MISDQIPGVIANHPDLPSARFPSGWFGENHPSPLMPPPLTPTLLLGNKFPHCLVVFRVESNLSPLLQNAIAVVPTLVTVEWNKICLTILTSVMNNYSCTRAILQFYVLNLRDSIKQFLSIGMQMSYVQWRDNSPPRWENLFCCSGHIQLNIPI